MATHTVTVSVLADSKPLQKEFSGLSQKLGLGKLGTVVGGLGKTLALGTAAVGAAAGAAAIPLANMASDLEQSIGGVNAIFKEQADVVHGYAESAATDLGLTQTSYNQLATIMGTQLKAAGVPMDELTGQTDDLIGRSADLAATFGGPVTKSSNAMAAALRGEFEPLRAYGVSLSVAEINARALADTGKATADALTKQEKALATQALIYEQSADAAGQFARESDTLAGQVERGKAELGNLAAELGTALLPAITAAVAGLRDHLGPALQTAATWVADNLVPALASLATWVGDNVLPAIQQFGTILGSTVLPVLTGLWERVTSLGGPGGMGLLSTGLANLQALFSTVAGVVAEVLPVLVNLGTELVAKIWPAVQAIAGAIVNGLIPAATKLWEILGPILVPVLQAAGQVLLFIAGLLIDAVVGAVKGVITAFTGLVDIIAGVVQLVKAIFTGDWSAAWEALKTIGSGALQFITGAIQVAWNVGILGVFKKGLAVLKGLWSGGLNAIRSTATSVLNAIKGFMASTWATIKGTTSALWNGIKSTISTAINTARSVISTTLGKIKTALSNAWSAARDTAQTAWNRIKDAVSNTISVLLIEVQALPSKILSALGNLGSLLWNAGKDVIRGLINGIASMGSSLWNAVTSLVARNLPGPVRAVLGISSPSKVFAGLGRDTIDGLVVGLRDSVPAVESTVTDLSRRMARTPLQLAGQVNLDKLEGRPGGRGPAGGRTYKIEINTLAPSAEVGRAVVASIREFETLNGGPR